MEDIELANIISKTQYKLFKYQHCDSVENCHKNLDDRTFYISKDTLKFFNAKLITGKVSCSGLLFYIIETIPEEYQGKRKYRFVVFDIFGRCVNDRKTFSNTRDKATEAYYKWLNNFDMQSHYKNIISNEIKKLKDQLNDAENIYNALTGV